ncbi:MAG: abortive infection family protein [Salinisphaeraceae bacterium]
MTEPLEQAESLQNLLVSHATGGVEDDATYQELRQVFVGNPSTEGLVPRFLRTCRNLSQFWEFIKHLFPTYKERRQFIWGEFEALLDFLERGGGCPSDEAVSASLESFDASHVHALWSKALDRRLTEPEGAITMARTLLETVCKHILDEVGTEYGDADIPKLYRLASESLNIAPSQHTEDVFKQILGGCTSVVSGLGALRNRVSDSHGQGKRPVKPATRHAELAVNLSGAMATFLVSTWAARNEAI